MSRSHNEVEDADLFKFSLERASEYEQHLRVMAKERSTAYERALQIVEQTRDDYAGDQAKRAFAAFERRCLRIQYARSMVGSVAGVGAIISLIALIAEEDIHIQLARYLLVGFFVLFIANLFLWHILRLFPKNRLVGKVLFDGAMAPFHDLRLKLTSGEESAMRPDGSHISTPLLASPLSLTAFSPAERVRRIPLPGSISGLEYEPLIATKLSEQGSERMQAKLTERIEQMTEKIDRIEKSVTAQSQKAARKPSRTPHWYSFVTETMHKQRSPEITARWNGYHQQQVQLALDTAYEWTRAEKLPCITPGELKSEIARALKGAQLPVGLGGNDSESDVWIGQMFGKGKGYSYTYVRRYLTEPDFSLQRHLPLDR